MKNPNIATLLVRTIVRPGIICYGFLTGLFLLLPIIRYSTVSAPVEMPLTILYICPVHLVMVAIAKDIRSNPVIKIRQSISHKLIYDHLVNILLSMISSMLYASIVMLKNVMFGFSNEMLLSYLAIYFLLLFLQASMYDAMSGLLNSRLTSWMILYILEFIEYLLVSLSVIRFRFRFIYHAVYDMVFNQKASLYLFIVILGLIVQFMSHYLGHEEI